VRKVGVAHRLEHVVAAGLRMRRREGDRGSREPSAWATRTHAHRTTPGCQAAEQRSTLAPNNTDSPPPPPGYAGGPSRAAHRAQHLHRHRRHAVAQRLVYLRRPEARAGMFERCLAGAGGSSLCGKCLRPLACTGTHGGQQRMQHPWRQHTVPNPPHPSCQSVPSACFRISISGGQGRGGGA
jgi:hypothetical protein